MGRKHNTQYVLYIAMLLLLMTIVTSHTLLSLTYQYIVSCCKNKYNLVYVWVICTKSRVSYRRCRLERAITIDHRKKHKQHSFL